MIGIIGGSGIYAGGDREESIETPFGDPSAPTGVTDYDVWCEESVTLREVLENAAANDATFETLSRAIRELPADHTCNCHSALEGTINTPAEAVPEATRERLDLLVGKYL